MRYLILSDIHSNREALEAVLGQASGRYERVVCCGDTVGYGADPNWVTDWVRENVSDVVRGNHDRACAGLEDLEWFNTAARLSAEWTYRTLTPENLEWLRGLPPGPIPVENFQLLHGSPLDEDEYLLNIYDAQQASGYVDHDISFFGHTHMQGGFMLLRNGAKYLPRTSLELDEEPLQLCPDTVYLINPGSVGQPRDRDPRAAYAIYDPGTRTVDFHRAAYDIEAVQHKIRAVGLPDILAERLSIGA